MPRFQNPGSFFLGTLVSQEQAFVKVVMQNALANGYKRMVEPCAGAFAMSHLAAQCGWPVKDIEASDVMMFTAIMGYAITGRDLAELQIEADGYDNEDLTDPATVLWVHLVLRTVIKGSTAYYKEILRDLHARKTKHIEQINKQLYRAREILGTMTYRNRCMWDQLADVLADPHTLVCINPPTYTGGFEKYYDTGGRMRWKEPSYEVFDPETGLLKLMKGWAKDAEALVLCYEENSPGGTAGVPVFARFGVREGVNVYLTSNRPDEIEALAHGKKVARPNQAQLEPLPYPTMTPDYQITENSVIEVEKIKAAQAVYYRLLWTHGFAGKAAPINLALKVDGRLVGVFGYDASWLNIGRFGKAERTALLITYGMTTPHGLRLNRLLTMVALTRTVIKSVLSALEYEKARTVITAQITSKPESKEQRGLMKLIRKQKDPKHGFHLTYEADMTDATLQEVLVEWLKAEAKYRKARSKSLQGLSASNMGSA